MDISEIRKEIDKTDKSLCELIKKRMECSAKIAQYKKVHDLPIYLPEREKEIIEKLTENESEDTQDYIKELYMKIFEISRSYQQKIIESDNNSQG